MLYLKGTVLGVYTADEGVTKDGKQFGGDDRMQLQYKVPQKDGHRYEVQTLKIANKSEWQPHVGGDVELPVTAYGPAGVYFSLSDKGDYSGVIADCSP